MEILIAGDLAPTPTQSNIELFNKPNLENMLGEELLSLWNHADARIFNLETPLIDKENPIDKCGPNLITPTSTIKGIKDLNPSLVTLANNHILDQGEHGLFATQNILLKNNIPYIGAGGNLSKASQPHIFNQDVIKVGVYACAEHEFSIATEKTAGANPFDPLESLDHISSLKRNCDYVIVLYHGGKEHYRYPSPYLQKVCHKIVDKGADLIICQHSHCIGCFEEYQNSTIVYGQGNFVFNKQDNEFWNSGLIIRIYFNKTIKIEYVPILKKDPGIRLAKERDRIYCPSFIIVQKKYYWTDLL
jgi:poly-gamma-glutamate synthesis protein (capsule biosynthesis protein)